MSSIQSERTRIWLVTGDPGSGKSTVVSRILLQVRKEGFTVGGILTREMRSHGQREGFRLIDVSSEESGVLASVKDVLGPRMGKYRVDLKSLSGLGVKALEHAKSESDVVVCDEVGPMELFSPEFRRAVHSSILESDKPCICVIHKRLPDPLIEELKTSKDAKLFEVTYENRETIHEEIAGGILYRLRASGERMA